MARNNQSSLKIIPTGGVAGAESKLESHASNHGSPNKGKSIVSIMKLKTLERSYHI
jgi:hypothetical protein